MKQDVLIVGGGLNGSLLALALAQSGLHVLLVDKREKAALGDTFDGRSYALALASVRMLQALGLWHALQETSQPIQEIIAADGRAGDGPGPFWLHFQSDDIEESPMGYMVEDRVLRSVLLQALDQSDHVTVRYGTSITQQSPGQVVFFDDTSAQAQLIVGCDGRQSGVAARAGIKRVVKDYGQTALVCAVEHERPHHGIAHQVFMPPGPLAILPLLGNRSSIVWTERWDTADSIQALSDHDYLTVLKPRFGNFLGEISLIGQRYSYPLSLSLAEHYIAPRVALVGDAAHGIHPIAGQGLNLGLRDSAALAQVIVEARTCGEDIGAHDVLKRYEQWRRFDAVSLAFGTDTINRLYSNDSAVLRGLRTLGMGAVQALPGLRRRFIREAAGLSGDLPQLLKGQTL